MSLYPAIRHQQNLPKPALADHAPAAPGGVRAMRLQRGHSTQLENALHVEVFRQVAAVVQLRRPVLGDGWRAFSSVERRA